MKTKVPEAAHGAILSSRQKTHRREWEKAQERVCMLSMLPFRRLRPGHMVDTRGNILLSYISGDYLGLETHDLQEIQNSTAALTNG